MRFLNLTRVTCMLDSDSKLIREIIYNLKPGVHIIDRTFSISAIVAIAIIAMLRSLSARFPYNRSDR